MRAATRLLGQERENIPKGYDLETSFYHYSLDLAIEMYVNDKTMVPAVENNYPYPFPVPKSNGFAKFFGRGYSVALVGAFKSLSNTDCHNVKAISSFLLRHNFFAAV